MKQKQFKVEIYKRIGGSNLYTVEVDGMVVGNASSKWGARRLAKKWIQNNCCERLYVDRYTIRGDIEN